MSNATKADYLKLLAEIDAVAERFDRAYLTDMCVDAENVTRTYNDAPDFYDRMIAAAGMAAGQRAEDLGIDINKELGRVIY